MPELKNKKRERFCREYVIDHNGTQAAIRAKYAENSANEQAARLLANDSVKARIKELDGDVFDRLGVTQEKVAKAYADLAFTTSDDLFEYVDERVMLSEGYQDDESGEWVEPTYKTVRKAYLKPHDKLTKAQLSTIQEIRETNNGIVLKQYSRKDALDMIAKLKGMMVEKYGLDDETRDVIKTITRVIVDPKK
jgi:phage terminase small subunit